MPGSGSVSAADGPDPETTHGLISDAQRRAQRLNEARAANAPARKAATAARKATLATRNGPTGYRVGWWVRTNTPRSPRFHNRTGVVVTNNLGEVGIGFGTDWSIRLPDADAWFLPTELERIR